MFSNDIEKDTVITKLVPLTFSPEAAREAGSRGIDWERTVDIGDGGEIPETYHAVAADGSVIQLIDATGRYSMRVDGLDPNETFGVWGTFGIWGQVGSKSRLLIAEEGFKSLYIESSSESCSGDGAFIAIREPASNADGSLVATAIIDSSVRSMETANAAYGRHISPHTAGMRSPRPSSNPRGQLSSRPSCRRAGSSSKSDRAARHGHRFA